MLTTFVDSYLPLAFKAASTEPIVVHPLAGTLAPRTDLVDIPRLCRAYYVETPDPSDPAQKVSFGTSGHRGCSLRHSFNESHVLAIAQAVCEVRRAAGVEGPVFLARDTHAISDLAWASTLEVLAAHGVLVMIDDVDGYTPTPAVSFAIVEHNRGRTTGLADGIVLTPSHNPPEDGGFKYNPPHGGPADDQVTAAIEKRANQLLEQGITAIRRISLARALRAETTVRHDFRDPYIRSLEQIVDMEAIAGSKIRIGADPMGGAGTQYWSPIAERYKLSFELVHETIDPTFSFLPVDGDGRIRMDCSSKYAMAGLVQLKDRFDIAFGNDADYDRHGIVTPTHGLLNPNHFLATAIEYLFQVRGAWPENLAIGKTLVSSSMIDRVGAARSRRVFEVPVGFKWFVEGLATGVFGFAGEESAGASFVRRNGQVWTTDKDGIVLNLLSAEMTAVTGQNPGQLYDRLTARFGEPVYERIDAPAQAHQKAALKSIDPGQIDTDWLAGEPIRAILNRAPGNGALMGGIKVVTDQGWFAARPSGTEDVYKIYAESFSGREHLRQIQDDAQAIVERAFTWVSPD